MNQTVAEKIISGHAGRPCAAGETVIARVDLCMANDGSGPLAIDLFRKMGGSAVFDPEKIILVKDHYVPCLNDRVASLLKMMDDFAEKYRCRLYRDGDGICHQLVPQDGHVLPGDLVIGADSHSCTYGALNAFGTGVGASDFAATMISGEIWLKTPKSIRVILDGKMPAGTFPKDVALDLVGRLGSEGASYCALEFEGEGVAGMEIDGRLTICNMAVEAGAKAGIMPCDDRTQEWLKRRGASCDGNGAAPDPGAGYFKEMVLDCSALEPQVAKPHRPDLVAGVSQTGEIKVHMAVIGTCTNGRLEDLRIAAELLRRHPVAPGVKLLIIPASRQIMREAMREGIIDVFLERGALVMPPSCGPCCGSGFGIPGDGENIVSTANRNFLGRMGNTRANIFLASPATAVASAIKGHIADPRRFLT